ncbi:MAG: cytosine permease [Rubrobacteraceae bacterium]
MSSKVVGEEQVDRSKERTQDYPLTEAPNSARRTDLSITIILLGFTFFVGSMFAGGNVGPGFSFWNMVGVIALGSLLLGCYVAVLSVAAQRSGLNTVLLARYSFGNLGSRLVDFLLGFTQVGWYAWSIAVPAVILVRFTGEAWGIPLMVLFALAFTWTAYIGISALAILSRVAVPAMLILVVLSLGLATRDAGGLSGLTGGEPTADVGIALAITLIFGSFASGGTQTTNWTRFSRTAWGAGLASLIGFTLGNGLMVLAGAIGATVYGQPDLTEVLALQGLLVLGLLLMLLNVWTTADRTVYAFSVAGSTLLRTENRRRLVVGGALIGLVLAASGFYNFLVDYLVLLGTFIPPIGAIVMADYFVKRRGSLTPIESTSFPAFNWAGIAAYVVASAIAQFSPGIAPVNGILAGFVLYLLFDRVFIAAGIAPSK